MQFLEAARGLEIHAARKVRSDTVQIVIYVLDVGHQPFFQRCFLPEIDGEFIHVIGYVGGVSVRLKLLNDAIVKVVLQLLQRRSPPFWPSSTRSVNSSR